ncbi:hypothetical protein [Streptomyces sp. ICBB 8177]|uniref:hypothetical protein n=1 Tax=Streptomyces sp. ICBB 8177 TaxID=563922 RepID=UPI000D67AAD6|nr:hypothetical protein [Streptomyces sp. ICBB 8177]PWI43623.1 hypothetical protein CK485_16010 [Streptomyces sp. ICBB 8177]
MVTYHEAMTADLSKLGDAARQWSAMAGKFGDMATTYRNKVLSVSTDGSWTGVSAQASVGTSLSDIQDIQAAQKEAQAVASILKEAEAKLAPLQSALKKTVSRAQAAGMIVGPDGSVSADPRNPDYDPHLSKDSGAQAAEDWARRIGDALSSLQDEDYGVRVALDAASRYEALPTDSDFNASADGDIARDDAHEAARLALQLDSAGKLTGEDMSHLQMLMRSGDHDTDFSQTLLTSLGADNTLRLATTLNHLSNSGAKDARGPYASLESEVALSLASATKDPKSAFYQRWVKQLTKAGTHSFGDNLEPVYGYQSLVTLMSHGGDGYGTQFLSDVGDGIIAAEKAQSGIWNPINGSVPPGTLTDPLDGLLGIMGKEPAAAQAFLDPAAPQHRLQYLLNQRQWPYAEAAAGGTLVAFKGPADCQGFGAALEAATTGRPYGSSLLSAAVPHSKTGASIMSTVVNTLGGHPDWLDGDDDHPAKFANLRADLGDMSADYIADFQRGVSGYTDISSFGAPADFEKNGGLGKAAAFLGAVGSDSHAYAAITGANQAFTGNLIDREVAAHNGSAVPLSQRVMNATGPGTTIAGLMSGARAQAVHDSSAQSDKDFNENSALADKWATRIVAVGADKALEHVTEAVPIVGTVSEWVQDDLNDSIMDTIKHDNALAARASAMDQYSAARDSALRAAQAAVTRAARMHHLNSATITDLQNTVANQVNTSFGSGTAWEKAHHG